MVIAVKNDPFAHQHMYPRVKQVKNKTTVFRQVVFGAVNKTVHFFDGLTMLQHAERRKGKRKFFLVGKIVDVCHMGNDIADSLFFGFLFEHGDFVTDDVYGMKLQIRMTGGNRQQHASRSRADFNNPVVVKHGFVFCQHVVVKSYVFLAFGIKNVIKFGSVLVSLHLPYPVCRYILIGKMPKSAFCLS